MPDLPFSQGENTMYSDIVATLQWYSMAQVLGGVFVVIPLLYHIASKSLEDVFYNLGIIFDGGDAFGGSGTNTMMFALQKLAALLGYHRIAVDYFHE